MRAVAGHAGASGPTTPTADARLYRALLRVYPTEFRARYGDEMVQLFGDQLRDARASGRPGGLVATWIRTFIDLVTSAASEHIRRDRAVAHSLGPPPGPGTRLLGLAGVVGGVVLLAAFVIDIAPEINTLRLVLFNAGAIAIGIAVHRRQAPRSPRLSLAVAGPMILINAWYLAMVILSIGRPVYPEPDPEFRRVFFYLAIALWLSDGSFALVALRIGVVWRWAALALMIGSLLALLGVGGLEFDKGPLAPLFPAISFLGIGLNGFGWIALGLETFRPRRIRMDSISRPESVPMPPANRGAHEIPTE